MKISVAQIKPEKGDLKKNIETHKTLLNIAVSEDSNLVVFPLLSLTGYEPKRAKELAIDECESFYGVFSKLVTDTK